jgi:DNA-binding response OmpR family regulator
MRQEIRQMAEEIGTFSNTWKVLIFDEDIETIVRHAEPFEAQGFEVHKCMSIESAMRCIEREEFDIAVVDQGSTAFEGRRVIRHLVRYNSPVPLIVTARSQDDQCCQQALELGATEYLEKPVSTAKVNRIIQEFFDLSELRQQ